MRKVFSSLHDRLPEWAADWLAVLVPLAEVTVIALAAWLLILKTAVTQLLRVRAAGLAC